MQKQTTATNNLKDSECRSFRNFLKAHRTAILIILLVAFGARLALVLRFPHEAFDEIRYTAPAVNMLAGRGFSADVAPPYLPSEHTVPLYPLFIASFYLLFGESNSAVRVAQALLDVITCLLLAFVSYNLAPANLRNAAALGGLIIYGFLSWFTVVWTRYVLTETLTLLLTVLSIAATLWAMRGGRFRWLVVGGICGLALLTRADSVVLVFAFLLFLGFEIFRKRSSASLINLLIFCLAIPVVLSPWIVRNYLAFRKFQPLANAYGKPHGEYVPAGYILWIRTWMKDDINYHQADLIFHPGNRDFDPRILPAKTFDSEEEKEKVFSLIDRYNQTGEMTPDLSDEFLAIANARIKRNPFRFYLSLPLQRAACMWLTGFSTSSTPRMLARIILVLPILVGGIVGFLLWARGAIVPLLLLIIATRTLFFSFLSAEARYMVEAYPLMISACAVTSAVVWLYVRQVLSKA